MLMTKVSWVDPGIDVWSSEELYFEKYFAGNQFGSLPPDKRKLYALFTVILLTPIEINWRNPKPHLLK